MSNPFIADILTFLNTIPAGTHILPALAIRIKDLVYPQIPLSTKLDVWFLFSLHAIVLILSALGIWERHKTRNLWFFKRGKDARGIWHPNTSVVSQLLFAFHAFLFMIAVPWYSLERFPTEGSFVLFNLCFVPLGAAFFCMCWSTSLAPSTSLSFLRPKRNFLQPDATRTSSSATSSTLTSTLTNTFILFTLLLFILSTVPGTVLIITSTRNFAKSLNDLIGVLEDGGRDQVVGDGALIGAIVERLEGLGGIIESRLKSTERIFKIQVGVYLTWALILLVIYIPTSLRLLRTLSSRRKRLIRTLNSLQKLEEIVTQDDLELKRTISPELLPQILATSSHSTPTTSPALSRTQSRSHRAHHRPIDWKDIIVPSPPSTANSLFRTDLGTGTPATPSPQSQSNSNSASQSNKVQQARQFAERVLEEVGISEQQQQQPQQRDGEKVVDGGTAAAAAAAAVTGADQVVLGENRSARLGMMESKRDLGRTSRLLTVMVVQLGTVVLMCSSYLAFCFAVVSGRLSNIQAVYIPWTSWTFVIPALFSSTVFYVLSRAASKASDTDAENETSPPPPPPPPHTITSSPPPPTMSSSAFSSPTLRDSATRFTADSSSVGNKSPISQNSAYFPPSPPELAYHQQAPHTPTSAFSPSRLASVFSGPFGGGAAAGRMRLESVVTVSTSAPMSMSEGLPEISDEGGSLAGRTHRSWVPSVWVEEQERERERRKRLSE